MRLQAATLNKTDYAANGGSNPVLRWPARAYGEQLLRDLSQLRLVQLGR